MLGPLSYYPSTGNPYSFGIALLVTPVTALITGLLMGILEIRYMNKRFRLLSFSKKILYKSIVYLVIIICFLVAVVAVAYSLLLGHSVVSAQVWTRGIIRKEIVFTGDVLNTTARIQGLCNAYGVDNLISGEMIGILPLNSRFNVQPLGEQALRGRDKKIALFTIREVSKSGGIS